MMDARLKTPEDPRSLRREECIVEEVLGIIGGVRCGLSRKRRGSQQCLAGRSRVR